ncbi:MAG TPA: RHS repeat-associated core domain-containing protein, partial [Segetibacter sp.]
NAESSISNNRNRFTSYDRSERTGLDYAVNRTYDSKQGRFTQVDPIGIGASSLSSPQTLNLYSYCGNDPINYTDPSGLFFGSLFKWIGKIFKAVLIAVAVFVAVVAVMALTWGAGTHVVLELALMSASLFAQALAPPKIGAIIGIITGIVLMQPGVIVNFAGEAVQAASKIGLWQSLLSSSALVGSIANNFAQDKKSRKRETAGARRTRLIVEMVRSALWRLENMPGCKDFVQGEIPDAPTYLQNIAKSSNDPTTSLKSIYEKGNVKVDDSIPSDGYTDGAGSDALLRFKKNVFSSTYRGYGMNAHNTRTMLLLHELRHAHAGPHWGRMNNDWYNKQIGRKCFGLNIP